MLRFGTAGIRGPVDETVTPAAMVAIGLAAAEPRTDVALGRDGRETGAVLADALAAGLASGGATVERLGVLPTPALAFASQERRGAMITASHNPPADNGVKFFVDGRALQQTEERRIEQRLEAGPNPQSWEQWSEVRTGSIVGSYQRAVAAYLEPFGAVPSDLSIVVDCGCGTASLVAPGLLRDLGATVRTLNATIDGTFPARASKPTAATLGTLRSFVSDGPADLGLAFDGDADRLVVVDSDGAVVHEDTIVAILAEQYLRSARCEDPVVVTTPNASERIDDRVQRVGGRTERVPLGRLHEGVAAVLDEREETDVVFAAEPWKHMHPRFGGWIDGLVSAGLLAKLVAASGLDELRAPVRELPYLKDSVRCPDGEKADVMAGLEEMLPSEFPDATVDTEYGIRLGLSTEGWVLVRPSGTEPKIRLYVEAEAAETIRSQVKAAIAAAVDRCSQ